MSTNLRDISKEFGREADEIEGCFHQCAKVDPVSTAKYAYIPAIDGCLTALWDAWGRFVRTVAIQSAAAAVIGGSGNVYAPRTRRTETESLRKIRRDAGRPGSSIKIIGGEPSWSASTMLLDICQSLELANSHPLHGAVSSASISLPFHTATPNPLDEIRDVRNFCAHKGDKTYRRMRRHFSPGCTDSHEHMQQIGIGGISTFSHWVDCMKVISEAATQ